MVPDGWTEWTDGRRQNYIPPTSSGDKNSQLGQDLPISVIDRVISPFREGFIFAKLRAYAKFRENKTLTKISELTVIIYMDLSSG